MEPVHRAPGNPPFGGPIGARLAINADGSGTRVTLDLPGRFPPEPERQPADVELAGV